MRFSDRTFEMALEGTVRFKRFYNTYVKSGRDDALALFFPDINAHPEATIKKIADFIGLQVTSDEVATIKEKFTKTNVKKIIQKNDQNLAVKEDAGIPIDSREIIRPKHTDRTRSFDQQTGFQTGHVSNYKKSDYREKLSASQIEEIESKFRDLDWDFDILKL